MEGLSAKALPLKDEADLPLADRPVAFTAIRAGLLRVDKQNRFLPAESLTRQDAAEALSRVICFAW
jgi:hypothetical protein